MIDRLFAVVSLALAVGAAHEAATVGGWWRAANALAALAAVVLAVMFWRLPSEGRAGGHG